MCTGSLQRDMHCLYQCLTALSTAFMGHKGPLKFTSMTVSPCATHPSGLVLSLLSKEALRLPKSLSNHQGLNLYQGTSQL